MRGNAALLHRAVENVVRNALQHAGEAKRIEILLETPAAEGTGPVLLRVRDHGDGLGEAEPESLFEPFQRGRTSGGFGLGLAIARRAVAVHHGSIHAQNLSEGGVEVQITLPLDSEAPN